MSCDSDSLSGQSYSATKLAPEDEWIAKLDLDAFRDEIKSLGKQLAAQQGPEDVAHLNKIVWWSRLSQWVGALTMWYSINPVSIFLLSIGCMTRWTCIGHHVCHGGYDKLDTAGRYNRFTFAVGSVYRRATDWLDWMLVEAWNCEHNQLHHYYLGEDEDPDLVEENLRLMRETPAPRAVKVAVSCLMMTIWKWWYYAPNTFKVFKANQLRRAGKPLPSHPSMSGSKWASTINPDWLTIGPVFYTATEFFVRVLGPFFLTRFVLLPAAFGLLLGRAAFYNSLVTLVAAELLTNAHAFLNIVTNHAGDDLYRFEGHCSPRSGTYFLRQVSSLVPDHLLSTVPLSTCLWCIPQCTASANSLRHVISPPHPRSAPPPQVHRLGPSPRQVISSVNFRTGTPHTTLGDLNDFFHGWRGRMVQRSPSLAAAHAATHRSRSPPFPWGLEERATASWNPKRGLLGRLPIFADSPRLDRPGSTTRSSTTCGPTSRCCPTRRRRRSCAPSAQSTACRTCSRMSSGASRRPWTS